MMMLAQISNFMSNTDFLICLGIIAVPFLLVGAAARWPAVMAIICIVAFIYFVGIPIVLFMMLAFAGAKGKR